jgi:regulatory protein
VKIKDTFAKARDYAYRILSYRPRSQREIVAKLSRRGFDNETIAKVVDYLIQLNYINDSEFAHAWVESRMSTKPMGLTLLRQELKNKGISNEIIDEVIEGINRDYDEYKVARNLFLNRYKRYSHLDKAAFRRRIYAYLKRRGFSSEIICKLIQEEIR